MGVDFYFYFFLDAEWVKTVSEVERNYMKDKQSWNLVKNKIMMSISLLSDIIKFQIEWTPVYRLFLVSSPSEKNLILFGSPVPHVITVCLFLPFFLFSSLHVAISLPFLSQLYVYVPRVHVCMSEERPLSD